MSSELKNRILFTLLILVIYRIGTFIPLPGIDTKIISDYFNSSSNSIFNMINMFSGGAFQRMSIFALNIMPYITASIIIQLLGSIYKSIGELGKEGEAGRRKLNQYTKYLTLVLGFFQSVGIYYAFFNLEHSAFISSSKIFLWTTVFSLLGSTMFLMWLGDKITHQGIGNGISILIAVGIIAELPTNFVNILQLSKSGMYSIGFVVALIISFVLLISFVIYVEKATRNIKIQYPNRALMKGAGDNSYIPLKINISGVIPPIFASSIITFPLVITQFFNAELASKMSTYFQRGSVLYVILFSVGVVFFSFFYSSIVFDTEELADNLKKSNCFIAGIRPGKNTTEYFDDIINKLNLVGSIYLIFVCIIPDILFRVYSINLTIGGTSLLIIVSTMIDLITQFQSYAFSDKYNSVNKRRRVRVR
ncbi:MAG: preprotein translocase subunit SecY [Rickettsiales bacterium]|nr:preprotein translocase subunit SecY [Rickettsiales bacterium]